MFSDTPLSLHISDEGFASELLSLPTPMSFIDFETFSAKPSPIPGTRPDDAIPCQWSNHILYEHGLDWENAIQHDEFLWEGDWGFNPIYAFVESLYYSTSESKTILIYSPYEIRCLNLCKQLAENDIASYKSGIIDDNYVVVNAAGRKVPLMTIAPRIEGWCNEMLAKMYDLLNGWSHDGGVAYYIQSPDLHNSNSIKKVCPVCMDEYSRTAELFDYYGIPADGYAGFARMGHIAKGDECTSLYAAALERPQRRGYDIHDDGASPFDPDISSQCLIYCCLDTLSMVLIYLAVLEATQRYIVAASCVGQFVKMPDGMFHAVSMDAQYGGQLICTGEYVDPSNVMLVSQRDLDNLGVREFYGKVCPRCRRDFIG